MVSPNVRSAAVFLLSVVAACASGAAEPNLPQTLPEYLRQAALENAGLKAAFEGWKAALEQVPQAEALPDPRFTYAYFIEEVETRVGPQEQRFSLSQTFPWFGTIEARADAAASEARAARERYEATRLNLFYEVKDAFYEYVYLKRAIEVAEDTVELVRHFEEVARARYAAARAEHPDVIRAQIELAIIEDKLEALRELRAPIVARLNAVLNRPAGASLPWPEPPEIELAQISRDMLSRTLRQRNPQLTAKEFELAGARSRITLAKKQFYPDIAAGVDWIDTDEAIAAGVRDSGKDPVILMFSLNLPIWRSSYKAAELQARAAARRVRHERTDLENDLIARVERVLYDFEDSGRKLTLYRDVLVPRAEELLGASEAAYTAGTVDFLSLLDAERTLLDYLLQRERAWTNRRQRLAQLEMLVGADLSRAGAATESP